MIRVVVNGAVRLLVKLMARVRITGRSRLPETGPLLVVTNHINFFEVPVLYFLLQKLNPRALTKAGTWDNPALRILANLWGAIPLRRGAVDREAFSRAERILAAGGVVVVTPEGTRSHHGRLQRASAGIVMLASRTQVPVLPIGHWGGEKVLPALSRLRREVVRVRIGRTLDVAVPRGSARSVRERELERLMAELAALLPESYRGHYGAPV